MSRTKLGLIFISSLAISGAAVTLNASPVEEENTICPCTECLYHSPGFSCSYTEHRMCGLNENGDCWSADCNPNSKCF